MAKYGKWVGLGLGWALGGPIGGILGLAFGSMFDSMQSGKYEYKGDTSFSTGDNTPTRPGDFAASLIVLSAAVMKADGKVLKAELDFVKQFYTRQFGQALAEENILLLREILKQDIDIKGVTGQVKQYMDYSSRLQLLHYLFGIAMADRHVHEKEVKAIGEISYFLGISSTDLNSIKGMFYKDIEHAYNVLEIDSSATDEEVKKAYRKMAIKYHPDKVLHLGEEFQKAAKEKFQKVNAAYEQIKKERGIN